MKRLLVILLLAGYWIPGQAQDSLQNRFTARQAIDYAFEHQADHKNAILNERIAEQTVKEYIGIGTPQINGSADLNDFLEIPTTFLPAEVAGGEPGGLVPVQFGAQYSSSASLTASQLIFDGTYLVGLKATRTYEELARKQTHQTRTDLAVAVMKAYYGALVSDARLELLQANIDRVNKLLVETKALNQAGFAEKIDVDRIELSLNNLLVDKERIVRFRSISYALLKFQMGMNPNQSIELSEKLQDFPLETLTMPDTVNYQLRPEYQVLETQRLLSEYDLKRYKAAYYPSLSAFGSLGTSNQSNDFDLYKSSSKWYPNSVVGLQLNVPIWDGLQRNARVQKAKLGLMQVDNSIDQAKKGFELEYQTNRNNYETNLSALDVTRKNVDLAKEIVRVSKVKYENGIGSSLELINAESDYRVSEANLFNSIYDTIISKIDLDRSTGALAY